MKTFGARKIPVLVFDHNGRFVAEKDSVAECARWYNVSSSRIRDRIRDGRLDKILELFFDYELSDLDE